MHDLDPIAVTEHGLGMDRAWHDLQISLNGDLALVQAQGGDQAGQIAQFVKCALFAIDQ
jgi:hypothetical protein